MITCAEYGEQFEGLVKAMLWEEVEGKQVTDVLDPLAPLLTVIARHVLQKSTN